MSAMPSIVRLSGPWGYALLVLACVVLFLAVRSVWMIMWGKETAESNVPGLANTILFWGVASAVIGILGQCHGVYLALNSILAASEVSVCAMEKATTDFIVSMPLPNSPTL